MIFDEKVPGRFLTRSHRFIFSCLVFRSVSIFSSLGFFHSKNLQQTQEKINNKLSQQTKSIVQQTIKLLLKNSDKIQLKKLHSKFKLSLDHNSFQNNLPILNHFYRLWNSRLFNSRTIFWQIQNLSLNVNRFCKKFRMSGAKVSRACQRQFRVWVCGLARSHTVPARDSGCA